MNMQVYLQIAEINTKMKAVRSLLARVENQQASIQYLMRKDATKQGRTLRSSLPQHQNTGDEYIEKLMRIGPHY